MGGRKNKNKKETRQTDPAISQSTTLAARLTQHRKKALQGWGEL